MGDATPGIQERDQKGENQARTVHVSGLLSSKRTSIVMAGSSVLALSVLRLCPLFHPVLVPLRIVPAFCILLVLPGYILLNWLLPNLVHSCIEAVPLAVGASVAFWGPLFVLVMFVSASPAALVNVVLLAVLVLFVSYVLFAEGVDERDTPLAPPLRDAWILWLGIALTAGLMMYKGGFLGSDGPRFHLATVRRIVDGTRLSLEYVTGAKFRPSSYAFPLWHVAEAVISVLSGVEPAHVWYYGPAILVPVSVLAIRGLVKGLFGSQIAANLAVPVYILSTLYYHHRHGYSSEAFLPWNTINWPGGLNQLILLPVTLTVLVDYLRRKEWRTWVPGVAVLALGLSMGAIHSSQLFFLLAWLLVFVVAYPVIAGWDGTLLAKSVAVLLVFGLVLLGAFWAVNAWLAPEGDLSFVETVRNDNDVEASHYAESYGFSWSPMGVFPVYPVLGAAVLLPLLLVVGAGAVPVGGGVAVAGLISAPLIYLEPPVLSAAKSLIPNLSRLYYQVPFLASILTLAGVAGWLVPRLERWVGQVAVPAVKRMSAWARWLGFSSVLVLGALLVLVAGRCESLGDYVRVEQIELSSTAFFLWLAAVAILTVTGRLLARKGHRRDRTWLAWMPNAEHPTRTLGVVVACSILLAIPGLLAYKPLVGQPLLSSDMNEEVSRFFGSAWVQQWWDPGLIAFLGEHTEEDAIVWSEVRPRQIIPVYVNRRCKEVNWTQIDGVSELRETSPTYILLKRPQGYSGDMSRVVYLSNAFRTDVGLFTRVYESDRVALIRMNPTALEPTESQLDRVLAANAHFVREEWGEASIEYEAAVSLDPSDPLARLGLGRAYIAQGEHGMGLAQLDEAVALRPEDTWLHFYLAQAHAERFEAGGVNRSLHLQSAATSYARSLAWDSGNVSAAEELLKTCELLGDWCQQGGVLHEGSFDGLVDRLEEMARSTPEDSEILLTLAHWCRVQGRDEEAAAAYEGAIERFPAQAHAGLAELRDRQGLLDQATDHYESAASASEGFEKGELLWKAGRARELLGESGRALEHYLASAAATVDSGVTRRSYVSAAEIYLAHDNADGARALVRGVVRNEPENASSWLLVRDVYPRLIQWYREREDFAAERLVASELLAVAPDHEDALEALTLYDFVERLAAARVTGPGGPGAAEVAEWTMRDGSDRRQVISMLPRNEVSYGVELPSSTTILRFSMGLLPARGGSHECSCGFEILVTDAKGGSTRLYSERVADDGSGSVWHDREVSLADYAGQRVTIGFAVQPGLSGDRAECWAGWGAPRLTRARADPKECWSFSEEEESAAEVLRGAPSLFATRYPLD